MKLIASVTRWFLTAVGLAALVAWFWAQRNWMLAAPAAIVLAGLWYVVYRIEIAFRARSRKVDRARKQVAPIGREIRWRETRNQEGGPSPEQSKRRFLYFDPESGEEVRKCEAI